MKKSAYEKAGVSIDRGNEAVDRIKTMVKRLGVKEIGKFGGWYNFGFVLGAGLFLSGGILGRKKSRG